MTNYTHYIHLLYNEKNQHNLQGTSIKVLNKKVVRQYNKDFTQSRRTAKKGDLFYKIDKYISFNKLKLRILKSLKQGLLQKIFYINDIEFKNFVEVN